MVISDGQERVLEALEQKTNKAIELYANLVAKREPGFCARHKRFQPSSSAAGVSAMKTKDQIITKDYAIYNSDCMEVLPTLPDNSVDMSVYSPRFAGCISIPATRDLSNCETREQFLQGTSS